MSASCLRHACRRAAAQLDTRSAKRNVDACGSTLQPQCLLQVGCSHAAEACFARAPMPTSAILDEAPAVSMGTVSTIAGPGAIKWTRLSCRSFNANAVRLQLHALAYNLGNFLRTFATPDVIADCSLTSLREKLIKIGAKVVSHGRYVTFQMAELALPRQLFAAIMQRIAALRSPPMATAT